MKLGIVGQKIGMTRLFKDDGSTVPVTVFDVSNNRITQIKTSDKEGYNSLQIAFGKKKEKRLKKPQKGLYSKTSLEPGNCLFEIKVEKHLPELSVGKNLSPDIFSVGNFVDVTGFSKGKGFSGVIKRHNFASNRESHGNSLGTKKPGSTGQNQDPGRVFPGKRMPGQYGNKKTTSQNLQIIKIDSEKELLLVKGSVAGFDGSTVLIRHSIKKDLKK